MKIKVEKNQKEAGLFSNIDYCSREEEERVLSVVMRSIPLPSNTASSLLGQAERRLLISVILSSSISRDWTVGGLC